MARDEITDFAAFGAKLKQALEEAAKMAKDEITDFALMAEMLRAYEQGYTTTDILQVVIEASKQVRSKGQTK